VNLMSESLACNLWQHVPPIWTQDNKEPMQKLSLEIRVNDDVTVVYCRGRIVYDEAATLSEKLAELLPHSRQLVLELSGVKTIDGAGLGELVVLLMWAQANQGVIKFAAPTRRVYELLKLTRLASVFEIHPRVEDAILAFRGHLALRS
jgi:anti-sigma B factor antagonist